MSAIVASQLRQACVRASTRCQMVRSVARLSTRPLMWDQTRYQTPLVSSLAMSPQYQIRCYSGADPLTKQFIHDRVMLVLNLFDKIDNAKLTLDSHFLTDLGLDSLDHVEIMLMMEDEFGFEIPDDHGEKLVNAKMIIQYVADHEDIYE